MTKVVRRIALTLNVLLVASVLWAAIIVPWRQMPWQFFARQFIQIVAAGTAVLAITLPKSP